MHISSDALSKAGTSLIEPPPTPELQQLALNFMATFLVVAIQRVEGSSLWAPLRSPF